MKKRAYEPRVNTDRDEQGGLRKGRWVTESSVNKGLVVCETIKVEFVEQFNLWKLKI